MRAFELNQVEYAVSGFVGLSLTEALRLWKAKFETPQHFTRDVIKHPALEELGDFVTTHWDEINPITVQEALQEHNMEKRRMMFDCIGVAKLFSEMKPELLDRQTISKSRTRWNEKNRPYEHRYDDTYELYRLDGEKLFVAASTWNQPGSVFAVRCWCTTTGREYWIYVPEDAATGKSRWSKDNPNPDAIRAIAWSIRINITNPKRIFRQGDIIVVEESENSATVEPYHLNKDQYLHLMYSET